MTILPKWRVSQYALNRISNHCPFNVSLFSIYIFYFNSIEINFNVHKLWTDKTIYFKLLPTLKYISYRGLIPFLDAEHIFNQPLSFIPLRYILSPL